MVGRRKKSLLAGHQRSWLWGRNLVGETLAAGRWPITELLLAEDLDRNERDRVRTLAEPRRIGVELVSRARLGQLANVPDHQGYLARVGPFPYADLEILLGRATEPGALFLVLDGIQDPFNLGAMIRSAEVFGASGVVLGTVGQAGINTLAARASAGAVNRIAIARAEELATALGQFRERLCVVAGAAADGRDRLDAVDWRRPSVIVIGNEAEGLSTAVRSACDVLVRIEQAGGFNSLNAAAAAAVCLYEVGRQRRIV
jgi:23S rRNA (guanosine2251-2'-O)-methyltransferase